jgi:hypothetical protein
MNLVLGIAIFVILWWLAFFPGAEHGAPKAHNLGLKMALATGIAAVLWLGVAWAISVDLFHVYAR